MRNQKSAWGSTLQAGGPASEKTLRNECARLLGKPHGGQYWLKSSEQGRGVWPPSEGGERGPDPKGP